MLMRNRTKTIFLFTGCLAIAALALYVVLVQPAGPVVAVHAEESGTVSPDPGTGGAGDVTGGAGDVTGGAGDPTGGAGDPTGGAGDPTGGADPTVTETPTPTPTPTPDPALASIKECLVLYKTEEISVEVVKPDTQVYYCILKKETDNGGKLADLLPAAKNEFGTKYYIDISTVSASKDAYIGVCTELTARADGLIPVKSVKVAGTDRKITFNVDWSYEGSPKSFDGRLVLENIELTTMASQTYTYRHLTSAETATVKDIDNKDFLIQWRKGANGDWRSIDDMTYTDWESMKNSGAIMYLRLDAENQTVKDEGHRFSKENKIKIAITKAPAVKVDVSKLSVSLKNGMQFRVNGATVDKWFTILPYQANSATKNYLREKSLTTTFSPFKESTVAKITTVSIKDIKNALDYIEPVSPTALVLDVRIAATTKKPASRIGIVSIPSQAKKPTVGGITKSGDTSFTIGAIAAADTLIAAPAFEYTIVSKADADAQLVDYNTLKWSTIKTATVLKDNLKGVYNLLDEAKTRRTVNITDAGACLLVRRRGVGGSSKSEPILASEVEVLPMPAK